MVSLECGLSSLEAVGRHRCQSTMTRFFWLSLLMCLCLSSVFTTSSTVASAAAPSSPSSSSGTNQKFSATAAAAKMPAAHLHTQRSAVNNREFVNAKNSVIRKMVREVPRDSRPPDLLETCDYDNMDVLEPHVKSVWATGNEVIIRWDYNKKLVLSTHHVQIELWRKNPDGFDRRIGTIADSVQIFTRSFKWIVDPSLVAGDNYYIHIFTNEDDAWCADGEPFRLIRDCAPDREPDMDAWDGFGPDALQKISNANHEILLEKPVYYEENDQQGEGLDDGGLKIDTASSDPEDEDEEDQEEEPVRLVELDPVAKRNIAKRKRNTGEERIKQKQQQLRNAKKQQEEKEKQHLNSSASTKDGAINFAAKERKLKEQKKQKWENEKKKMVERISKRK